MSFHKCEWTVYAQDMDGSFASFGCDREATVVIVGDPDEYTQFEAGELAEWFACDGHKEEMSDPDLSGIDVLEVRLLERTPR